MGSALDIASALGDMPVLIAICAAFSAIATAHRLNGELKARIAAIEARQKAHEIYAHGGIGRS